MPTILLPIFVLLMLYIFAPSIYFLIGFIAGIILVLGIYYKYIKERRNDDDDEFRFT